MNWKELIEARRSPEKNTREHTITALSRYEGQPNVFASFTSGFSKENHPIKGKTEVRNRMGQNKLGINPQSNFGTPLGIYTYPIDYLLNQSHAAEEISAPYTGSGRWRYLYIVRVTSKRIIDSSTDIAPHYLDLYNFLIETMGEEEGRVIARVANDTAHSERSPHSKFWNLARLFAGAAIGLPNQPLGKSATVAWNVIMRKIGVEGYVDDQGQGIVHPSEPTQAVFFTPQAFRVIDVIERAYSGEKDPDAYGSARHILREIKKRTLNTNAINPLRLPDILSGSSYDKTIDPNVEDLEWLASQMDALPKRLFAQGIKTWPDLPFNLEMVDALRKFGPLQPTMLIRAGVYKLEYPDLALWPQLFARQPTSKEWASIIEEYEPSKLNERLAALRAPWVDDAFMANLVSINRTKYDALVSAAANNEIDLRGRFIRELFSRFPGHTFDDFDHFEPTFDDWYRAARRNNHMAGGLGKIIPLDVAKNILMREDRLSFTPDTALLKRLIEEDPAFMIRWIPRNGGNVWSTKDETYVDFVAENLPAIAQLNPEILRFIEHTDRHRYHRKAVAAIWRYVANNGRFAEGTVGWGIRAGWITQEDFKKHLTPKIARLALTEWSDELDPELYIDVLEMLGRHLTGVPARLLPVLIKRHPDEAPHWRGQITPEYAQEIFEKYPLMRRCHAITEALPVEVVFEMFKKDNSLYRKGSEELRIKIIAEACRADPAFARQINDPNGPFAPWPTDWVTWQSRVSPRDIIKVLHGVRINDELAMVLMRAYPDYEAFQWVASPALMEYSLGINPTNFVTKKQFANDPPRSLLLKAQSRFMEQHADGWIGKTPAKDLSGIIEMLFSKMVYPPLDEIKAVYGKYIIGPRSE